MTADQVKSRLSFLTFVKIKDCAINTWTSTLSMDYVKRKRKMLPWLKSTFSVYNFIFMKPVFLYTFSHQKKKTIHHVQLNKNWNKTPDKQTKKKTPTTTKKSQKSTQIICRMESYLSSICIWVTATTVLVFCTQKIPTAIIFNYTIVKRIIKQIQMISFKTIN